jgi:DNA-binding SARP family transcriptional activator
VDVKDLNGAITRAAVTLLEVAAQPDHPPPVPTGITVELLGTVRVLGASPELARSRVLTEMTVYFALHREGTTTFTWSAAIWPDRRPSESTLNNRLSQARVALGAASDGLPHLRKRNGRHVLSDEVQTDWGRFAELASTTNVESWERALALVRGRPIDGLRHAQWTVLEGVVPAMEAAIGELACRLIETLLDSGDPARAEAAARRAVLASPWDERLYRLLMRAAHAAGNRAGVDATVRQLATVLEAEGADPLKAVHPETAALYRQLTSTRRMRPAN